MPSKVALYDGGFYESLRAGSTRSATVVLRHLKDLLLLDPPNSIVDIGCGDGSWLRVSREFFGGVRILGVDGSAVQEAGSLKLLPDEFLAANLETEMNGLGDRLPAFELAMCLEVAEHLPNSCARPLVEALCRLAGLVLFSAAVPNQGGTHHINEQWPSYWIPLFAASGFRCIDAIRPVVWSVPEVEWWYRQNLLLFASEQGLERWPRLATQHRSSLVPADFDIVHPEFFRIATARTVNRRSLIREFVNRILRNLSDNHGN